MSDQSAPPDPLELLKRMWAPMSLPIPGMVVPLANAADVEKRIADLRSVEHWLTLNLNVVKMSIQGLEMQRATLAALEAAQQSVQQAARQASKGAPNQGASGNKGEGTGTAGAPDAPAQTPLEAWWTLLQQVQAPTEPQSRPQSTAQDRSGKKSR
jgi:hypothetical protein